MTDAVKITVTVLLVLVSAGCVGGPETITSTFDDGAEG